MGAKSKTNIQAAIVCHDDSTYLSAVIAALEVPVTVFVSREAWGNQAPGDWQASKIIAMEAGATVVLGDWLDETEHRRYTLEWAKEQGVEYLIIPDTDEVLSKELLDSLKKIASVGLSDAVYCAMDTYWKSPEYVIRPRERLMPAIMVRPETVNHIQVREYRGQLPLMISHEHGVLHHLSYSGPDSRILRKLSTWSHRDEVVQDWVRDVWHAWDGERNMQSLHPTHPHAYGFAERCPVPEVLGPAWKSYVEGCGGSDPLHPARPPVAETWPSISVIIPLYGGPDDLRLCLSSLRECEDLLHEVIVIDDCSPDQAPEIVTEFPFCKLVRNPVNLGFGATCNRGAEEATGDVLLFLNSDTAVPRIALEEMMKTLLRSGTIGAVGPVSNAIGHFQRVPVCYLELERMPLFAEDLSLSAAEDYECDMLVGFCLAVRQSSWEEVGPFDESFRVGMFEDNDLCYRMRRAGYRLLVVNRAFVHHKGHASLDRSGIDKQALFNENEQRYLSKWTRDIETGFASHLAGMHPQRIVFDEAKRPERLEEEISSLRVSANVSLCMIVRNEERVLGDCLASAKPFFQEMIIVDTGSSDRTVEIAKEHGAKVFDMVWPDSFAGARNESLKHATGDWVCWLDADDTLPFGSGYAILKAVTAAPDDLGGLVMPIRFVNDDPEFGTSVDHVKVFRNHRGWKFEGRIHEQILQDIRRDGLNIARLNADVLHTGYDTSEEGQEKKRVRDEHLLMLDLEDRPGHPFVLFNLGMTAHYLQKHEEAIEWLRQSVEASQPSDSHVRKAYAMWAVSAAQTGGSDSGLAVVDSGLKAAPDDPELLFRRGMFYSELERYDSAASSYERVLQVGRGRHFGSMDTGIFGYKTMHNLAGVYVRLGNYARARENFLGAMRSNSRFSDSAFALFPLAMGNRDGEACEACLRHLAQVHDFPRETLVKMRSDFQNLLR